MKKVARNFKKDSDGNNLSGVRFSIVAANNHYAGFGPGTVNIFRQLLGLEEVKWGDEIVMIQETKMMMTIIIIMQPSSKQSRQKLSDF
jgi:hypothetical protein